MTEIPFLPLIEESDHEILKQLGAHFGSNWEVMLEYYQNEGKGCLPDIELERIEKLMQIELSAKQNLADILLSDQEKEEVQKAKAKYADLRQLYEGSSSRATLIADLILSEEDLPENEINALVAEGAEVVPALIQLMESDEFASTLYPGYGLAPSLAAKALGAIGDTRALIPLYNALGSRDFFEEDAALSAFKQMGAPAKEFLLGKITNEKAAIALLNFAEDEDVAKAYLNQLEKYPKDPIYASYLALGCIGLKNSDRQRYIELSQDVKIPSAVKAEMADIIKQWKKFP